MCDIGHGSRSASSPTCLLSGRIPGSSREKDTCKRPAKHYAPQRYRHSCDEPILRRTYLSSDTGGVSVWAACRTKAGRQAVVGDYRERPCCLDLLGGAIRTARAGLRATAEGRTA